MTLARRMSVHDTNINDQMFERVKDIIDKIRPAEQQDGGDIELLEVTNERVVRVRLHGACVGCPSSSMTLKGGIQKMLQEHLGEPFQVESTE